MSNHAVGAVYATIIQEVLESSRVDLEENGVDESILEELKQGWQRKLSAQHLAQFPWDPKPDPPPAAAPAAAQAPPPSHSSVPNGATYQSTPMQGGQTTLSLPSQPVKAEPAIKMEPGLEPAMTMSHPSAQANLIANLQNTFGDRAGDTISKIHEGLGRPANSAQYAGQQRPGVQQTQQATQYHQAQAQAMQQQQAHMQSQAMQMQQHHPQQPQQHQQQHHPQQPQQHQQQHQAQQHQQPQHPHQQYQQQQYRQQMAANQAQMASQVQMANQQQQQHFQPQPQAQQNGQRPSSSQLDGAGDEEYSGVLLHRDAAGQTTELGRVEIDNMLHAQMAARAKSMEGGGLMLPLKRASKGKRVDPISYHRTPADGSGPARFDGGDDDVKSEADDEAINSDLDDSDDNNDEEDEDDEVGQIMLCMYDKVQRVKNKWKCVLKDGVLTVNGKDYLFHKATGEYEW